MRIPPFQQQIFLAFVCTLTLVFSGAFIAYNRIEELQHDRHRVDETQEIIKLANLVLVNIVQAESSVRGLAATGNAQYMEAYNVNLSKINPSVDRLISLLSQNTSQKTPGDSLRLLVSQKLFTMSKILWKINLHQNETAKSEMVADQTLAKVQELISTIKNHETILLENRREISEQNVTVTIRMLLAGGFILLLMFLFLFQYIRLSFKKRMSIEESLRETNHQLKAISEENQRQNWILKGCTVIDEAMRGQKNIQSLSTAIIEATGIYTHAAIGAIYINRGNERFYLEGTYAWDFDFDLPEIGPGDGWIGQVIRNRESHTMRNVPADYLKVKSALGQAPPKIIFIQPVLFEGEVVAVMELGFLEMPEITKVFLERITHNIGMAVHSALTSVRVNHLIKQATGIASEYASR